MIFKIDRARFAQAMFPYLMDLVHHGVRITPAEHPPSESLEPGEVYRSSLDAPLSVGTCWNMLAPKTSIAGAWAGRRWSGFGGLGSLWKVMATQNLSKWQVNIVPKCSQRVEVWAVGCWLDYVRFFLGTQAQ